MVQLTFECLGARVDRFAVAPTLLLRLRVAETTGQPVAAVALHCQIRLEPGRRRYDEVEAKRLRDLFGETSRWADTLKPFQLVTVDAMVPSFAGATEVDLSVPCSYDLEVASARYFASLETGEVPLLLLFSGTVFSATERGLSVSPVPWSNEASYRLPVAVWREMMDLEFPDSGWLRLRRETLDALGAFKSDHALPTWDAVVTALLDTAREPAP